MALYKTKTFKVVDGDTVEINRSNAENDQIRVDIFEDDEKWACAYLTPNDARVIAAELIRLADEIEELTKC